MPPTEFRIFKAGANPSEKGTFLFDNEAALSVMSQYAKHGKTLRIDYNHGTTIKNATPEMAVAAGSFVPEVRGGELWATGVKWTSRASQYLSAGEYCEFSPLFNHDDDGRVLWLRNLALTNLPALDETTPLIAASATEGDSMETECKSCASLTAQLTALSAQVAALKAKTPMDESEMKASAALRSEITALTGTADVDTAIGKLRAHKTEAERAVALAAEVAKTNEARLSADFDKMVDDAVTSLRVTPGDKETFRASYLDGGKVTESSVKQLAAFVKFARPQMGAASTEKAPAASGSLPESAKTMAKAMGLDAEAFAKFQAARPV